MTVDLIETILKFGAELVFGIVIAWIWREQSKLQALTEGESRKERGDMIAASRTERSEFVASWQQFFQEQRQADRSAGLAMAEKIDIAMGGFSHRVDNLEVAVQRLTEISTMLSGQLRDTNSQVAALGVKYEKLVDGS